tara:strand:+ start:1050 stop:1271 length:222 start_codon:yes stop_codon:yes gene_type:complete
MGQKISKKKLDVNKTPQPDCAEDFYTPPKYIPENNSLDKKTNTPMKLETDTKIPQKKISNIFSDKMSAFTLKR